MMIRAAIITAENLKDFGPNIIKRTIDVITAAALASI